MKKLFLIAALVAIVSHVQAQGYFNFSNSGRNAPIYVDKVGGTLAGTAYRADYVYATGNVADATKLTTEGLTQGVALNASGVFFGGQQVLSGYVGQISIQIRAWLASDGATFDLAAANPNGHTGLGNIIQITCPDSTAAPKPTMPNMVGLQSFAVVGAPEPGTIALGVMGVAALLFRRRK